MTIPRIYDLETSGEAKKLFYLDLKTFIYIFMLVIRLKIVFTQIPNNNYQWQ